MQLQPSKIHSASLSTATGGDSVAVDEQALGVLQNTYKLLGVLGVRKPER